MRHPVYTFRISMIRYEVQFTGRVQGVGFRFTTVSTAKRFAVTGWVRNEPDGSVRCIAEGDQAELDQFISAVKDAMSGNIKNVSIDQSPAKGEFSDFSITRSSGC